MYGVIVSDNVVEQYEELDEAIANACQLGEVYRTDDVDVVKFIGRVLRRTETEYVAWEDDNANT
jgi:hypothetical protein